MAATALLGATPRFALRFCRACRQRARTRNYRFRPPYSRLARRTPDYPPDEYRLFSRRCGLRLSAGAADAGRSRAAPAAQSAVSGFSHPERRRCARPEPCGKGACRALASRPFRTAQHCTRLFVSQRSHDGQHSFFSRAVLGFGTVLAPLPLAFGHSQRFAYSGCGRLEVLFASSLPFGCSGGLAARRGVGAELKRLV